MRTILTAAQIKQFHEDGYLVLPHRVAAETCDLMLSVTQAQARAAIEPLEFEADVGYAGAPDSRDAPGGRTVRRLRNAHARHACFRDWAEDADLTASLAQLFGERVCLTLSHHNCVMTKHPDFGTATGWHRDIRYWSFAKPDLISVWLALREENATNGGLKIIPGSHRMAITRAQLDDLDFLRPDVAENQALFAQGMELTLQAGDVVFFHSGLFHAAGRNNSASVKTSVVFAYHGVSNSALPGTRSASAGQILLGA